MATKDFHKELEALTKRFGKPNFIIYGWQEGKEFDVSFSTHKVPLKTVIQGILHVLQSIVEQTMK